MVTVTVFQADNTLTRKLSKNSFSSTADEEDDDDDELDDVPDDIDEGEHLTLLTSGIPGPPETSISELCMGESPRIGAHFESPAPESGIGSAKVLRKQLLSSAGKQDSVSSEASCGNAPSSRPRSGTGNSDQTAAGGLRTNSEFNITNESAEEAAVLSAAGTAISLGGKSTSSRRLQQYAGSQVAVELSDMVVYCQAVKFKAFPATILQQQSSFSEKEKLSTLQTTSRTQSTASTYSAMRKFTAPPTLAPSFVPSKDPGPWDPVEGYICSTLGPPIIEKDPDSTHSAGSTPFNRRTATRSSCYQVASLNETAAKKLCRKHPLKLIAYTKDHIVRTYPAGMRIDSSNFNPLVCWSFGLQMIALNYQTPGMYIILQ